MAITKQTLQRLGECARDLTRICEELLLIRSKPARAISNNQAGSVFLGLIGAAAMGQAAEIDERRSWGDGRAPAESGDEPDAPAGNSPPSSAEVEAEAARASAIGFAQRGLGPSRRTADPNVLDAAYRPPASPYLVQAGSTIAASLVTALNSDRPGRVVAQVTENVFDAVTGDHLLIPQGARLIGVYDANTRYGDQRLVVTWHRLILPNGYSIAPGDMTGIDATGAAGVRDRVDAHLSRIAIASVLSGILSVAANEAESDDNTRIAQSVGDASAQEAARVGGRIVDREMDVRPTIRVRAGARIRVFVHQDIVLRPYAR